MHLGCQKVWAFGMTEGMDCQKKQAAPYIVQTSFGFQIDTLCTVPVFIDVNINFFVASLELWYDMDNDSCFILILGARISHEGVFPWKTEIAVKSGYFECFSEFQERSQKEYDRCLDQLCALGQNSFGDFYIFRLVLRDFGGFGDFMMWVVWIGAVLGIIYQFTFHSK